jgi:hypothetical protein
MSDKSDPLHESLREFVDAERARPDPSPEAQQRTFARLSATLGLVGGAGDGPTSSPPQSPPASASPTGHTLARVVAHGSRRGLATFLVGAALGATAYGTVAHLQQKSRATQAPSAEIAPRPPEPVPLAPEPRPEARARVEDDPPRPVASPTSSTRAPTEQETGRSKDQGLAAERKWIEMARTALARGRVDGALAALRHHARVYPSGQLAEERDSLLVQSLVAKGDYAQARAQAARFGRQHPRSLFSPAIEQALRSIP